MNTEIIIGIGTTTIGLIIGFYSNYIFAKFNARQELIKSLNNTRSEFYLQLWQICETEVNDSESTKELLSKLDSWYGNGGGLFLNFDATTRFKKLQQYSNSYDFSKNTIKNIKEDLSWMKTELKYSVGSYTKDERSKNIPTIKLLNKR